MTHPQAQDDEALVEVMARAMGEGVGLVWEVDVGCHDYWLENARAALTALRNHEGRK